MGDENFDGCECVWSHELAMRRLLSLIRQGQSHCTDTECIDLPNPGQSNSEGESFTMMTMVLLIAVILFFLRPNSFIRTSNDGQKSNQPPPGGPGSNGDIPPAVN